jgi:hypothetical protein
MNNHNEQCKDRDIGRTRGGRAGRTTDALVRLLCGEPSEELSRELKVEAHRLAARRDDFVAAAGRDLVRGQGLMSFRYGLICR